MLKAESESRQNQIVARIFSVLGMKFPEDDEATDELLTEWKEALAELSLHEIGKRVKHWKEQDRTPPADEFAKPLGQKPDKMSTAEVMEKAKKLYDPETTFEQAYRALNLHQRWGELPEGRT